jgi:signal transduction histidine kinase
MLTEILFVLLVLTVGTLMVVDVIRTPGESPHEQTDRPAYGAERADRPAYGAERADRPAYGAERAAITSYRGPDAVAFSPEPAGSVTAVPAPDLFRTPESIGPPPGSGPHPGTESAYREGSRSRLAGSDARSRIFLLAVVPAVTAAVVTLCVVRIVTLLNGTSIHSPISSIHDGAVISVVVASAVLVIVLALGLWATIKAARFVLSPWQRLQTGVLPAAGSSDETGEPTDVFGQMRREISRLTANEAQLRRKLNAMFVSLGHRGRSLVERQIRLIGNLERGEQDAQRLADLAKVNRIAIRLYRNSENLLVLAGQEPSTGSNPSAALTYLVQAAASEVEEGERVSFDVQPDIAVRGPVTGDVVHLLAELIQNATSFSAADMPVRVTGHTLNTGGVLVEITDGGIGMTAKEMAYANWQLENPPATDIDVPKWMGLLVVARLAARHRIRVRLNHAESGGLTAYVWLPDEVLTYQGAAVSATITDFGGAAVAPSVPEVAVDSGYVATGRMSTAARSAELASARGNPLGAPPGPRLATDTGQRPGRAWAHGGMQPVSFAEQPAPARAEPPVSFAEPPAPARAEPPAPPSTEPPLPSRAEPSLPSGAEPAVPPKAKPPAPPQAEETAPPQAEQPATLRPSGSAHTEATAEDAGVSSAAAWALGDETSPVEVIMPPAEDLARTTGSPIYRDVESVWFRSGRQAPGSPDRTAAAESLWSSPADEGWHAAQTVDTPASGGSTAAGLPRRLPKANLVPGSIPSEPPPAAPNRSAAAVRDRFAGLQRGVSEGRAAVEADHPAGNDDS